MAGRPPGKWNDKAFKDALRIAVNRTDKGAGKRLAKLADVLVAKGLEGDVMAIREIADRLDGKAHQSSDTTVTTVRYVIDAPEPAATAEDWAAENKPH